MATAYEGTISKVLDLRVPPEHYEAFKLNMANEWDAYLKALGGSRNNSRTHRDHFHRLVSLLTDGEVRPNWCYDCALHIATETTVNSYASVCKKCAKNYKTCGFDGCTRVSNDLYQTSDADNNAVEVCGTCLGNQFLFCGKCSAYYHPDNVVAKDEHLHVCSCLKIVADGFTIRNDGEDPLANDTRVTVQMPGGTISSSGIVAIRCYLSAEGLYDAYYKADAIGNEWQTREGNWTKRLAKALHKDGSLNKLNKDQMSMVGTIAAQHTSAAEPYYLEITRNFARSAADFHHGGSCWWSGYEYSKCTLKTLGGFGMRTFADSEGAQTAGRAWVLPLKKTDNGTLVPTSDTDNHDAFIVFNGYGNLQGYAAARLLAHMAGWTYKQDKSFSSNNMSVNGESGYIVAPQEILNDYAVGYLSVYNKHQNPFV